MRRYKEERKPPSEGVLDLEGRKSKGDGDAQDTRRRVGLERCARRKMLGRAWTPLRESGGGGGMETDARRIEGRLGGEGARGLPSRGTWEDRARMEGSWKRRASQELG